MTETALTKTDSEKFTNMVLREFSGTVGNSMEMTPYQRQLASHLFIKVNATLDELETKRLKNPNKANAPTITWGNVNLNKLAIDCIHRINLGLDALIQNHVHPIPYLNSNTKKYDLDLRIGYVGKDFYRRDYAIDKPSNVIYELVYSTDKFTPKMKSASNQVETYEFEITSPFDRGEVTGGFGYISYDEPSKNKLVLVPMKRIKRAQAAGNKEFWTSSFEEMAWKTVVIVTTDKLNPDPKKVNESFFVVENQDNEAEVEQEITDNANGNIIDIEPLTDIVRCPKCNTDYATPDQEEAIEKTGQCLACHKGDEAKGCGF